MWIRKLGIIVLLAGCLCSCKNQKTSEASEKPIKLAEKKVTQLPFYNTADFTPTWNPSQTDVKKIHKISDFSFTNQLGNKITNKDLNGYIYVANFFFTTCPSICVRLTNNMLTLQDVYQNDPDIKLISHSVFPEYDSVEILKKYGERFKINPEQWYLVTGEKDKIYKLARDAYFADDTYKQTHDKNAFIHTENLVLVDKQGHIRGVYKGTLPEEVERLQRHIEILKKEG
ncbi:SCO family protein [Aquimarina sp. ERC-38]|uniref:SCO family protein n=1 Tax=Aquimarina sp. ERC-38 TaxID=2949996 RepID=UPI0022471F1F|nr:SCO family protein [Aquimarina sp. ERC-38]UZO80134.1 SCO family protein [Aquimarina sp. ERC-38]